MRRLMTAAVALGVLAAGCNRWVNNSPAPYPAAGGKTPSADELVAHVNQGCRTVQSVEFDRVAIDAKQGSQIFSVNGQLAFQKPRNFRLMAYGPFNVTEADVGSNQQEFWFWFKRNSPPALFRCTYEEFPRVRANLPVHPDWIAEALCVNEIGSPGQYQLKAAGQTIELHSDTATPQGQPVHKVILVAHAGPNAGRIVGLRLRSPQGNQELWSAEVTEYRTVSGVALPRVVALKCPAEKLEMTFRLDEPRVNALVAGKGAETFARPTSYGQEIDLARGPAQTQSFQRVRGKAN